MSLVAVINALVGAGFVIWMAFSQCIPIDTALLLAIFLTVTGIAIDNKRA